MNHLYIILILAVFALLLWSFRKQQWAKQLLLLDFMRGLKVTLPYFFKPKITVQFPEDGQRRTTRFDIDAFKCIHCGLCEEACPVDSIVLTNNLHYTMQERGDNIMTKEKLLAIGDAYEAEIAACREVDKDER
jgi:formate hydrogenlyase subunit 6/NADH:ubiquinone oxidoreductase subunit I